MNNKIYTKFRFYDKIEHLVFINLIIIRMEVYFVVSEPFKLIFLSKSTLNEI